MALSRHDALTTSHGRAGGPRPIDVVPLDRDQTLRFELLMDSLTLVDMHEHPMVLTDDVADLPAYFRGHAYQWAYEAVRVGGWTAVGTANGYDDATIARIAGQNAVDLLRRTIG